MFFTFSALEAEVEFVVGVGVVVGWVCTVVAELVVAVVGSIGAKAVVNVPIAVVIVVVVAIGEAVAVPIVAAEEKKNRWRQWVEC